MMLNYISIDKLHGFMMHSVILAIGCISCQNDYSFQFSNVGKYAHAFHHSIIDVLSFVRY